MRVLFLSFAFALHLSLCLLGRFVVVHSNRFPHCCRSMVDDEPISCYSWGVLSCGIIARSDLLCLTGLGGGGGENEAAT